MKTQLIVIEGFDRVGKDHLLKQLKEKYKENKDIYVYIQNLPPDIPRYREDQIGFFTWLNNYIDMQIDDLIEISRLGYQKIYMTRLLVSDNVYTRMFNRQKVVEKYVDRIINNFYVKNLFFTYKNYNEYLLRLKMIGDTFIEYSQDEFNKVNELYEEELIKANDIYQMDYKLYKVDSNQYLESFLED